MIQPAFTPLTGDDALAVIRWRYRGRFARYNLREADRPELLRAEYRYHVAADADGLLGFYCAGPDARVEGGRYREGEPEVIDFGLGLHPARLGQGLGRPFAAAALAHVRETLAPARVRVTIARFNKRSVAVFEGLGFVGTHTFRRIDGERFVQLERSAG